MSTGTATSGRLEVALGPRRSLSPMDVPDRGRHSRRSLTPGDAPGSRSRSASPYSDLSSKVALFNKHANDHLQGQSVNPFSGDGRASPRPRLDKHDASYGKPVGKTALRGLKAQSQVSKEILELCEVIAENGESLSDGPGDDDPRTAISFGNLFHIYTYISSKVVGILLRARKQKLVDFEGETLFQKKDDHVPVIMLKPIKEIREIFRTTEQKERELRKQQEREVFLQEHPEVLIEEEMRKAYEEEMAALEEEEDKQRTSEVADQPKPAIEFQLQVQEITDDNSSEVTAAKDDTQVILTSDTPSDSTDEPVERTNVQEQPTEDSSNQSVAPTPTSAAEPTQDEADLEDDKSKCIPETIPEVESRKTDLTQTALTNPEERIAQEKSC